MFICYVSGSLGMRKKGGGERFFELLLSMDVLIFPKGFSSHKCGLANGMLRV